MAASPTLAFTTQQAYTGYAVKGGRLVAWLVPTSLPDGHEYPGVLWRPDRRLLEAGQSPFPLALSVFAEPDAGDGVRYPGRFFEDTTTMLEALDLNASRLHSENDLLAQAVAALVNAAAPTIAYQPTKQRIIDQSNQALLDEATATTSLSGTLFGFNEIGCQLA